MISAITEKVVQWLQLMEVITKTYHLLKPHPNLSQIAYLVCISVEVKDPCQKSPETNEISFKRTLKQTWRWLFKWKRVSPFTPIVLIIAFGVASVSSIKHRDALVTMIY